MDGDDVQRIDINFENILYTVAVPKQKGEFNDVLNPMTVNKLALLAFIYDAIINLNSMNTH